MNETRQRPRLGLIAVSILLSLAYSRPALAEEWLVVPIQMSEGVSDLELTVQAVESAVAQRKISLRDGTEAAERLERVESAPAGSLSKEAFDAWSARVRGALNLLARNDYEGAERELEPALSAVRKSVEAFNRDETRAKAVLDACLYQVRALLGEGKRETAQLQARECARWSPQAEPDAKMHPPSVRTFYEDIAVAGAANAGTLRVQSDPSGCTARVNGVSFGKTPARIERLPAGPYAVQVECRPVPGRVHHLDVERGSNEIRIDARFDEAVKTDRRVRMEYANRLPSDTMALDGQTLARILDLDSVLFVSAGPSDSLEFRLVDSNGNARASDEVAIPADEPTPQAVAQALDLLLGTKPKRGRGPPRGQFIAGVSLASAGTASLLTGYALYAVSATKLADSMVASPSNENQSAWLNTRFGMFYVGSAGAAMLVTAMPLALPYRAKTPWWAWLSGGAGLALAATSITLAVTAPAKPDVSRVADPGGYADRARRTDAAFLAGVTAAPLLAMPLVYLLRRENKRGRAELAPQLNVGRSGGFIGVSGNY